MTLAAALAQFGYPVLLLGAFVEGETVVLGAGFLAHRGYLALPLVVLCAAAGSLAGDQLYFHLGRRLGLARVAARPSWAALAGRVRARAERHSILLVLGFRFVYGMRIATPAILGASGYPPGRFLALNAAGAVLWASTVSAAGYFFGQALGLLLGDLHRHERWILLLLMCSGAAWALARRGLSRHPASGPSASPGRPSH